MKLNDSTFIAMKSNSVIDWHVKLAMGAGAIPLPFVDIAASTCVQVRMLKELCKIHDIEFNDERNTAIISSVASSLSSKFMASFVKTIPVIGYLIGAPTQIALSGALTYATGKAFISYVSANRKIKSFQDFNLDEFAERVKANLYSGMEHVQTHFNKLVTVDMQEKIKNASQSSDFFGQEQQSGNEDSQRKEDKPKSKNFHSKEENDGLVDVAKITQKSLEVFGNDLKAYNEWMQTPNKLSKGETPYAYMQEGRTQDVLTWLSIIETAGVDSLKLQK